VANCTGDPSVFGSRGSNAITRQRRTARLMVTDANKQPLETTERSARADQVRGPSGPTRFGSLPQSVLPDNPVRLIRGRELLTKKRAREPFIAIKEPWDRIVSVAALPGPCLLVYLHLLRLSTMARRPDGGTPLRWGPLLAAGYARRTLRRAAATLDKSGFVKITRRTGRKSLFSIEQRDGGGPPSEGHKK
jgi:hypothetical protein